MQDNPLNGFSDPVVRQDTEVFLQLMASDLGLPERLDLHWSEVALKSDDAAHQLAINGGDYLIRYLMVPATYRVLFRCNNDKKEPTYYTLVEGGFRKCLGELVEALAADYAEAVFDRNFKAHRVGATR